MEHKPQGASLALVPHVLTRLCKVGERHFCSLFPKEVLPRNCTSFRRHTAWTPPREDAERWVWGLGPEGWAGARQ